MQILATTDYTVRIVGYLCEKKVQGGGPVKGRDIAEAMKVTPQYCVKILNQLKEAGLVESVQGCYGGYNITPKGEGMTFKDAVDLMEGDFKISKCLQGAEYCNRGASDYCPVHKVFKEFQDQMAEMFEDKVIKDVWMEGSAE